MNHMQSGMKEKDLIKRGLYAPSHFTQELLKKTDIIEVIHRYVPLKRNGTNFFAKCPFHKEKTPSFEVIRRKQFYHCFSCGASGNVIVFLEKYLHLNYPDAIRKLAKIAGVNTKHVNFYKEDYFGELERNEGELLELEEKRRFLEQLTKPSNNEYDERNLEWINDEIESITQDINRTKECVKYYQWLVSIILQAQEKQLRSFSGKSYEEATGLPSDSVPEELIPFWEIDYFEEENEEGELYPYEVSFLGSGEERNDYAESVRHNICMALEDEEACGKRAMFWENNPDDTPDTIPHNEIQIHTTPAKEIAKELTAEQKKQALKEQNQANMQNIKKEISPVFDELVYMQDWLDRVCTYRALSESGLKLQAGDCWKLVLVYSQEHQSFTLVFWKRKSKKTPRDISEIAYFFSKKLTSEVGFHRDIAIPTGTVRIWWAAYIAIEDDLILVGHLSEQFWGIPKWIMKKCILHSGFWVPLTLPGSDFLDEDDLLPLFREQKNS